ncbi:peptide ABC transporter substrate-binding protein [Enterococcus faecalis]|uniref:peptide ABC transporter substrate-binding protein n=1 Tax=Enterococcus faecalis TaxID=1351 RepID=UPI00177C7FC1|nr:peptide ABC transporter substrate-binding protein [Enterococcus faecalis]MBD9863719.1 peptide ABC transporter substrate-binding protein [Enterococcus faecalis]MBD9896924.1 peptide ABC transporter substrate-binding protein [Enterococcus faecalis]MDT6548917.1 peptide ABC transporter substrate-binding protein [Enterococcus faecalis]MDT6900324.1 peptide ABC transporter substrate-binding protein [Enterococcus faecalis]
MGGLKKVGILVFVLSVFSSCGVNKSTEDSKKANETKVEQIATLSAGTPVQSLDPATAVDQTSVTLLANVMEGLYRLDEKNQPQPAIAAGQPKISNSGKTYTIVIRDGAKWADGTDITVDDFVTAWQRVLDPKTASPNVELFAAIKNAKEISIGKQQKETLGVKSKGNKTIEIELEEPTPYFTDLLALTAYFPVQQNAVKEYGKEYGTTKENIVTNGAFTLTDLNGVGISDKWTISKNPKYWDKKHVTMEKIKFQVVKDINTGINLYNDGQLDDAPVAGEYSKQLENNKDFIRELSATTMFLEVNQRNKKSITSNKHARQAINFAIDREAISNKILTNGSIPAKGVVPSKLVYNPKTGKDFTNSSLVYLDKSKAKDSWEKAKKELKGTDLSIDIMVNEEDLSKKLGEYLQNELQDTLDGLKVSVTAVPATLQTERLNSGNFMIALSGWQADFADPVSFLANFESKSSLNHGGYANEEYDKLLKNNSSKRLQELKDAEKLILEDAGVIPLLQIGNAKLRNQKISEMKVHSIGAKYDYKTMEIK